jgi:hypothetical protein
LPGSKVASLCAKKKKKRKNLQCMSYTYLLDLDS